ncbi:MAG TPA: hypothetical protein VJ891_05940 [Casimicrobiaceae bacterium]|nr:hypothetical protein [Casimicrobiaceae bacterium]
MHRKLRALGKYVAHLGAAMFGALLAFGIGTNLLVQWSEPLVSDAGFNRLMRAVERLILYADVALLVWWTVYSTSQAIVELLDE